MRWASRGQRSLPTHEDSNSLHRTADRAGSFRATQALHCHYGNRAQLAVLGNT